MHKKICILLLLLAGMLPAAFASPPDSTLVEHLKEHIYYLASDKLSGRNTGSKGEKRSYAYISEQYKKMGLLPKGESGFLQPFNFTYGKKMSGKNQLMLKYC